MVKHGQGDNGEQPAVLARNASRPWSRRFFLVCLFMAGGVGAVLISQTALAGDPFRGATLYARHCQDCHGVKGKSPLPGMPEFTWWGGPENGMSRSDRQLLDRIRGGGQGCPAFQGLLDNRDIFDIITHLRTLRR